MPPKAIITHDAEHDILIVQGVNPQNYEFTRLPNGKIKVEPRDKGSGREHEHCSAEQC